MRDRRRGERLDADVDEAGCALEQPSERGHACTSVGITLSASAAAALLVFVALAAALFGCMFLMFKLSGS